MGNYEKINWSYDFFTSLLEIIFSNWILIAFLHIFNINKTEIKRYQLLTLNKYPIYKNNAKKNLYKTHTLQKIIWEVKKTQINDEIHRLKSCILKMSSFCKLISRFNAILTKTPANTNNSIYYIELLIYWVYLENNRYILLKKLYFL